MARKEFNNSYMQYEDTETLKIDKDDPVLQAKYQQELLDSLHGVTFSRLYFKVDWTNPRDGKEYKAGDRGGWGNISAPNQYVVLDEALLRVSCATGRGNIGGCVLENYAGFNVVCGGLLANFNDVFMHTTSGAWWTYQNASIDNHALYIKDRAYCVMLDNDSNGYAKGTYYSYAVGLIMQDNASVYIRTGRYYDSWGMWHEVGFCLGKIKMSGNARITGKAGGGWNDNNIGTQTIAQGIGDTVVATQIGQIFAPFKGSIGGCTIDRNLILEMRDNALVTFSLKCTYGRRSQTAIFINNAKQILAGDFKASIALGGSAINAYDYSNMYGFGQFGHAPGDYYLDGGTWEISGFTTFEGNNNYSYGIALGNVKTKSFKGKIKVGWHNWGWGRNPTIFKDATLARCYNFETYDSNQTLTGLLTKSCGEAYCKYKQKNYIIHYKGKRVESLFYKNQRIYTAL